jgi:formylglycine-generating enzyme
VHCDFSATGYRLPTEAEWEYAAKGGSAAASLASNAVYAGSAELDSVAWYRGNSGGQTQPVGQKKANALGLYDMAGNVWEWCWDWYAGDYYAKSPSGGPTGASSGGNRGDRGGDWLNSASLARSAFRNFSSPGDRGIGLGFRVVRRS